MHFLLRLPTSLLLSGLLLAASSVPGVASPFSEAAERLDGEWRGTDYVLRVDAKRAQASINPALPFEWRRFEVKELRGLEIVFSIGAELYEATIEDEILVLTSTSFRGERILFRGDGLRGTTDE
jgi:hypothetical protein